jgi:hypothetical protein
MNRAKARQLKLFPTEVEPPEDDPNVARVLLNKVRLERSRQFGNCYVGLDLWKRLELDRFYEELVDEKQADVPWSRIAALLAINRLCEPTSELAVGRAMVSGNGVGTTYWESRKERSMTRGSIVVWTVSLRTRPNWNVISGSVTESCSLPHSTCCFTT